MKIKSQRILIVGGGTGGHVYPALAVANELVKQGVSKTAIRFIGARRGLEATVIPAAGFSIDLLLGRGLKRSFSPLALLANAAAIFGISVACVRAIWIVGRFRPTVVFGVGGYASWPGILAARIWFKPTVIHEQNVAPGLINRLAVRLGAVPTVSLPGTALPGAHITGNPVRPELFSINHDPDVDPPLVVITGGSLGARRLNDAGLDLYARWRARQDIAIQLITGPADFDRCTEKMQEQRKDDDYLNFSIVRYEKNMAEVYSRSTIIVSRSGATTCAELSASASAAILIPFPRATDDHQIRNAQALVDVGAAVVINDQELTGERLGWELRSILDDPARIDRMRQASALLAQPEASARVVEVIERVGRG